MLVTEGQVCETAVKSKNGILTVLGHSAKGGDGRDQMWADGLSRKAVAGTRQFIEVDD